MVGVVVSVAVVVFHVLVTADDRTVVEDNGSARSDVALDLIWSLTYFLSYFNYIQKVVVGGKKCHCLSLLLSQLISWWPMGSISRERQMLMRGDLDCWTRVDGLFDFNRC